MSTEDNERLQYQIDTLARVTLANLGQRIGNYTDQSNEAISQWKNDLKLTKQALGVAMGSVVYTAIVNALT